MSPLSCLVVSALLALTTAFGTINEPVLLGQHNEHEMITRVAFQCPSGHKSDGICFEPRSLDQLAGYHREFMGLPIPGAGFNGAVGSPDTLDPVPEGPEAHCDDADYLDIPGYPRTRAEATASLQACVDHLRHRFRQAWESAERLLDERRRIQQDMIEIANPILGDCTFAFPVVQGDEYGRAKCTTIEGLGRALHGVQDFYSHSNWADVADPKLPISTSNPPGLAMTGTAPFLDLRATGPIPSDQIPLNLTTGCFSLPDSSPGSGDCEGRVTHHDLSKDSGVIHLDGSFGEVGPNSPRAEALSENFRLAVKAAIESSRDVWAGLQDEIRHRYGIVSGNLMICALLRDDPVKDCRNRTVAVALDKSWESGISGGIQLERLLSQELNSRLTMHGLDKVAMIEFDESARIVYPMGYPKSAKFNFSQPGRQRSVGSGVELALAENIRAQPETYTDRGAILLLCTGSESREYFEKTLLQVQRAVEEGIRIHYGCINMPRLGDEDASEDERRTECSPSDGLVPAVLKTGGVVAFINSPRFRTPSHFINLVMDRGLVATDDKDTAEHTQLYPGITLADVLSPDNSTKSFKYLMSAGENLNFTVHNLALDNQGTNGCFTIALWNEDLDIKIATYTSCSGAPPLSLIYEATATLNLVLVARYADPTTEDEAVNKDEIVFMLGVDTSMPEKNETTTRTSTSILSTSTSVEFPGSTTQNILTSETLEIHSSTATIAGHTSSSSQCFKASYDGRAFYPHSFNPSFADTVPTISATTIASNFTPGF
jgi:hypothetical protein